jgi:hypothetical protein
MLNGLKVVDKKIDEIKVVCSGAGAAAISCLNLWRQLGVKRENITVCDSKGVIYVGRDANMEATKARYARDTSHRTLGDAMVGADVFFGLILPHGLLELTAVFVAAGVGLRVFWAWVEPGPRSRLDAVSREARSAMTVALGLVVVLFVSGVVEAFVTPSALPTWARIGIGVFVEALFLTYVFTLGRYAVRRGETGDVAAGDQSASAPTRA